MGILCYNIIMKKDNIVLLSLKYISVDLIGNFLYWPIWWYSKGLLELLKIIYRNIIEEEKRFGVKIWLINLFKPMYAQYDWQGRIISLFMRLMMLIFKTVMFLLWVIILSAVVVIWIFLPIVGLYMIYANLYNLVDLWP